MAACEETREQMMEEILLEKEKYQNNKINALSYFVNFIVYILHVIQNANDGLKQTAVKFINVKSKWFRSQYQEKPLKKNDYTVYIEELTSYINKSLDENDFERLQIEIIYPEKNTTQVKTDKSVKKTKTKNKNLPELKDIYKNFEYEKNYKFKTNPKIGRLSTLISEASKVLGTPTQVLSKEQEKNIKKKHEEKLGQVSKKCTFCKWKGEDKNINQNGTEHLSSAVTNQEPRYNNEGFMICNNDKLNLINCCAECNNEKTKEEFMKEYPEFKKISDELTEQLPCNKITSPFWKSNIFNPLRYICDIMDELVSFNPNSPPPLLTLSDPEEATYLFQSSPPPNSTL